MSIEDLRSQIKLVEHNREVQQQSANFGGACTDLYNARVAKIDVWLRDARLAVLRGSI